MIAAGTSAFVAILLREDTDRVLAERAASEKRVFLSAATATELAIVVFDKLGDDGLVELSGLRRDMRIEISELDGNQSRIAVDAYRRFGRGTGHPARLNYGDCFSYALAKSLDLPLLFKDDDFVHTDIRPALAIG